MDNPWIKCSTCKKYVIPPHICEGRQSLSDVPAGHEWKWFVEGLDEKILSKLHVIVCDQSNCCQRGYDGEHGPANCAFCADTAENIIGEYLFLMSKQQET